MIDAIDAENAPTRIDSAEVEDEEEEDASEGDKVWAGFVSWIEDVEQHNIQNTDHSDVEEEEEEQQQQQQEEEEEEVRKLTTRC